MKLRIKGNTLRLRLLRSEVERLAASEIVSEEIRSGPGTYDALKYSIASSDGIEEVTVQFSDNQILVLLPESIALDWTTGDNVSIAATQAVTENTELSILIEKDFECVGRPDDPDRGDAYPNPVGC